jgi:hypothetical protein
LFSLDILSAEVPQILANEARTRQPAQRRPEPTEAMDDATIFVSLHA